MRIPVKLIAYLLPLITAASVKAQQFGGNPPSINWKQVNTPAARVIFPTGLDSAGIRVANIITQMNSRIQSTIGFKQRQISILLQDQTTVSNGYVSLAPFRSEFYLTPDQNNLELGSLRFSDQLAVHEFRHVQQFNNFDVGLTKALHIVFGEGGQGIGASVAVPNWFFEGDAVFNETYVTEQGRGRLPYFFNGYRALWAAGKNYSWMKLRNGSYRDYVPDHYPLGYMMVSYGREKYGDDFWKKVTHDAAAYNGLFYSLQKGVKNYSGINYQQFRANALGYYQQQFGNDKHTGELVENDSAKHAKVADKGRHFAGDQEYPAYVDDNTIIYTKNTYDAPPVFVIKTNGIEKKLIGRNYSLDNYFDYHNGKIVYSTYRPDLRWGYRDYDELTLIDVKTGDEERLTEHTKYFSPALNEDASKIVTVKVGPDGKSELHILDTEGKLLHVIPNRSGLFYTYPKFYHDKIIAAVRLTDGRMTMALIDANTGNADYLFQPSMKPVVFPLVRQDKVYFTTVDGKNDVIFAVSVTDKKLYKMQSDSLTGNIGNYQITLSANKVAWTSFTAYGYQVHQVDAGKVLWQEIAGNATPGGLPDFGLTDLHKGAAENLLASVTDQHPPVTKYNKAYHLFNFHTLEPTFSDPNYTLALQGENVLNTLQTQLLFNYNRNEGYKEFGFSTVYGALFPYLSAGVDYIVDRETFFRGSPIYYNQLQYHGGLEVPLNFTGGRSTNSLVFGSDLVFSRNIFSGVFDNANNSRELLYLNNYAIFSARSRRAKKNIFPMVGVVASVNYRTAINGVDANQLLAQGNVTLPGIFTNHSLVFSGAYQQRDINDNGGFSNDFPFVRGYSSADLYQMSRITAEYHFPIFYPDAGVANAVYLSRIRGNFFYDYSHGYDPIRYNIPIDNNFRSVGGQLTFDGSLWNISSYSIGIRYSHLLDRDLFGGHSSNRFEIILPISLF